MSTQTAASTPPDEQRLGFKPEPGVGTPLAVGTFGFSVLMLGIPNSGLITADAAAAFTAVAFGTGAFGLLIGGLMEFRANNVFGGSFALFYSAFLLTTALMLRFLAAEMGPAFAAAFGTWLLLWCAFTFMLSWGAWYINMPAFLAFILLAVGYLFFGLANFVNSPGLTNILSTAGGWVLIVDGLVAWYLAWALAVNPMVGDKLPLWPHPYRTR